MESRKVAWRMMLVSPLIAGPIAATTGYALGFPVTLVSCILVVMLLTASVTDLRWRLIPNWITYSCFLWAIAINFVASLAPNHAITAQLGAIGIKQSLLGAFGIFAVTLIFSSITGGGAGDVKLSTCLGAFLGFMPAVDILLYSFVIGGILLLIYTIWVGRALATLTALFRAFGNVVLPMFVFGPSDEQKNLLKTEVPLGPFFALGTLCYFCEPYLNSFVF